MTSWFDHEHKRRVIINTDAKNEADDQFAIVHALLTPSFDIRGVIPAHFGTRKSPQSLADSREEVDLLLQLMDMEGQVRVADGATHAIPDQASPVDSPGARLIVDEAMRDDEGPLFVAFYGPLTDMASALLLEPRIAEREVVVVWIGGGPWPEGSREYNLSNDIDAANVVFASDLQVWQIPSSVYRLMPVSYAELVDKVAPCGELGKYLVEQLIDYNAKHLDIAQTAEYRSLGDSPAVGVIMYPHCAPWSMRPAPQFTDDMLYTHPGTNRPIRVYESIDARFIHEDFFAKLRLFARGEFSRSGAEETN